MAVSFSGDQEDNTCFMGSAEPLESSLYGEKSNIFHSYTKNRHFYKKVRFLRGYFLDNIAHNEYRGK